MIRRTQLAGWLRRAQTPARLAQQLAQLAVQAHKVTPLTAAGLVGTTISVLHGAFGDTPWIWLMSLPLPVHQIVGALAAQGWSVVVGAGDVDEPVMRRGSDEIKIRDTGSINFYDSSRQAALRDDVTRSVSAALPRSIEVYPDRGAWCVAEVPLTHFNAPQPNAIAAATKPLLELGTRCILLNGPPGVGKSTAARQIAAAFHGRTLVLTRTVAARSTRAGLPNSCTDLGVFKQLQPHTIIVDDIDKCELSLASLEELRSACKLLVLTANNGNRDDVLDGAVARCGRIDEEYQVAGVPRREAPFDQLDDATWRQVMAWPVAYQQEVAARIKFRGIAPEALRLDELERRLARRTRSRDVIATEPTAPATEEP